MHDPAPPSFSDNRSALNPTARIVLIILSAAHLLLLRHAAAIPSQRAVFLFFFISGILSPGYLLSLFVIPRAHPLVRLLYSFVLGTALFYAALLVCALGSWNPLIIVRIIPFAVIAASAFGHRIFRLRGESGAAANADIPRFGPAATTAVIMICIGAAALILATEDPLLYTSDSCDHIAYIRTISRTHEVFPSSFLYRDAGTLTRDIRKGLAHALWGTLNAATGRHDALPIWPVISTIGSVFLIIAVACCATMLFGSGVVGLCAIILFLLFYHKGFRALQLVTVAYPFPFGKVFYLAALGLLPLYIRMGGRRRIIMLAAASFAAIGTHLFMAFLIAFAAAVGAVVSIIAPPQETGRARILRRIAALAGALALFCVPYLLVRFVRDYSPNNVIHSYLQGVLFFTSERYVLNPISFFASAGPLFVIASLSLFLFRREAWRNFALRLLLCGLVVILLVCFNPFIVPPLLSKMTYLLYRVEFAIPSMILCAYLLHETVLAIRNRPSALSRRSAYVAAAAFIVLLAYPLIRTVPDFAYAGDRLAAARRLSCRSLGHLYDAINDSVPAGSVILSDPITSYTIPAFTDQFVVCTYDQHSVPNDSTALERILACRNMYLGSCAARDAAATFERFGAEYVVINSAIPPVLISMYWKPDAALAVETALVYRRAESAFEPIYAAEGVSLFEIRAGASAEMLSQNALCSRFLGDAVSPGTYETLVESGEPNIRIKRFALSDNAAAPGDAIGIAVEWVSDRHCDPASYIAYLRFDTEFKKGPLYRDACGKLYRKAREILDGRRYRFRVSHHPLSGIYPPDVWPPLTAVRDSMKVTIPRDAAAGIYTVRLKMARITARSNYYVSDVLTDSDLFAGEIVGQLTIGAPQ